MFRRPSGPHPRGASRLCQGTQQSGVPSPIIDPNKRHSKNRGVAQLVARLVWAAPASAACGGYSEQGLVQRRRAARARHARDGGDTPQSGGPNRGTRPAFSYFGSVRSCSSAHHRGVAQLVARLVWDQDAAGSNPVTSTIEKARHRKKRFRCRAFILQPGLLPRIRRAHVRAPETVIRGHRIKVCQFQQMNHRDRLEPALVARIPVSYTHLTLPTIA